MFGFVLVATIAAIVVQEAQADGVIKFLETAENGLVEKIKEVIEKPFKIIQEKLRELFEKIDALLGGNTPLKNFGKVFDKKDGHENHTGVAKDYKSSVGKDKKVPFRR